MLDDGTASFFYKQGCAAAFEKVGITLEQARAAYTRKDPQFMAWWSHQFGPEGMYHTMSPGLAEYIHKKDLRKQRATIPQLAGVFGVDVPKPFQQYADPEPDTPQQPAPANESVGHPGVTAVNVSGMTRPEQMADATVQATLGRGWFTPEQEARIRANMAKQGESLDRPEDQTYQVHRDIESPAHNGPDGPPKAEVPYSRSTTQEVWNEHDKRVDRQVLPDIDSRTGL